MKRIGKADWGLRVAYGIFLCIAVGALLLFFPVSALAKPSIRASVDRTLIGLGDRIEYTLTVTGDSGSAPDPKIPDFPGFDVSSTSQSSQYSFVNGSFSASKTVQLILVPQKEGVFTLPPAEIVVNRRVYKSDTYTITIKGGVSSSPGAQRQRHPSSRNRPPPMPEGEKVQGNLFISVNINKKKAYVGEQLVLAFNFYRRIRLFRQPEYEPPDTTGFWVEDLPSKKGEDSRMVNGRHYMVQEIKSALFPTAPGNYTIGPATLRVRTGFFTRPRILTTDPITVKVLPLPDEGRPADFTGAIGHFVLSASIDKKAVAARKPVTLMLTVAGGGNIKAIKQPLIKIPEGVRKYESKTTEKITPDYNRVTGEKRYETILVPQKEGDYTIEPIRFTYFDPDSARYKTLLSKPLALKVTPGEGADQQIVYSEPRQTEIALLNKDIRFIKPLTGKLKNQGRLLYQYPWFWYGQMLPLLVVLSLFVYRRQKERSVADIRTQRIKRAHKMAKKRLRTAEKFLKVSDAKSFYAEISRAICEYMGDKLNTAAQGMVLDDIRKKLSQREIPTDQIEPVITQLEQCDMARFASHTSSDDEMRRFLNETEEVIVRLDKLL